MNPNLRATIIAACKKHEKLMWLDKNWQPCVSIGEQYFVKFGARRDVEPERATQDYLFNHAQGCKSQDTPRIANILHHFMDDDECIMYLVMEYIKLQESPPDLDERTYKALLWLSEVPLPPNQTLGPVGGGHIRHKFFRDHEAPFPIADLATLDEYIQKAYNTLSPAGRKVTPQFSVLNERVMFTQSDMDASNFGVDENGRTVLMNFREVGVLPESFLASTLEKTSPISQSLGISGNSNGYSMAAIRASLWTASNTHFGMGKKILQRFSKCKARPDFLKFRRDCP